MAEFIDTQGGSLGSCRRMDYHYADCPWGPTHVPPPHIVNAHNALQAAEN